MNTGEGGGGRGSFEFIRFTLNLQKTAHPYATVMTVVKANNAEVICFSTFT